MKQKQTSEERRAKLADALEEQARTLAIQAARLRGESVPDHGDSLKMEASGVTWCPMCGTFHYAVSGYAMPVSAQEAALASGAKFGGGYFGGNIST